MCRAMQFIVAIGATLALSLAVAREASANGGPFLVKYPGGDPAAKGVLARLDPDLKPGRETQLRVVKEDLRIVFGVDPFGEPNATIPPLGSVSAEYTIENPTEQEVSVDFGFPILRGIYMMPDKMSLGPDIRVLAQRMDTEEERKPMRLNPTVISNSGIYGIIRARARRAIENGIAGDENLPKLILSVKGPGQEARETSIRAIRDHVVNKLKWNERDAALMVEYASLEFGSGKSLPPDRGTMASLWVNDQELREFMEANLGALSAIGEQKATQFFAQLASRFDPNASTAYEAIFKAWGGDVREMSVDIKTGRARPREVTADTKSLGSIRYALAIADPTIFARVDYLDPDAKISEAEKASCRAILKNLPVIFTFAPMNLLHYGVTFPARSTHKLTVRYKQFAYQDTRSPASYQLAYVVHPASFWDSFGPINLRILAPHGVGFRASVPCSREDKAGSFPTVDPEVMALKEFGDRTTDTAYCTYESVLKEKTGELFVALDAEQWKKAFARRPEPEEGREPGQGPER